MKKFLTYSDSHTHTSSYPLYAAGEERVSGRRNGRVSITAALLAVVALFLVSCGGANKPATDEDAAVKTQTPVTVTTIDQNPMADYVEMNATSVFQQKNYVKANANGYIQAANIKLGVFVNKGALLFTIKTKEAQAIGNSINVLDTTFKFSGVNRIKPMVSNWP
jgi:multidrug efflux pump subunit AcrA (membrane-fusion protein)